MHMHVMIYVQDKYKEKGGGKIEAKAKRKVKNKRLELLSAAYTPSVLVNKGAIYSKEGLVITTS